MTPRTYSTGRVFKHPRSRFWYMAISVGGKEIRKSTRLPYDSKKLNERNAARMLDDFLAREREAENPADGEDGIVRYETLRELLLRDYRDKGHRSLEAVKRVPLKHLDRAFAGKPVKLFTTDGDRVSRYVADRRAEGAARASVNYELAILRRMFKLGLKNRKITPAMVPWIEIHDPRNARQGFVTPEQFAKLIAALPGPINKKGKSRFEYLVSLVQWLYASGWRVNEARGLKWGDVDFVEGTARIGGDRTKNEEAKVFPWGSMALGREAIERARAAQSPACEYVFHRGLRPIGDFRKAWAKACTAAGLGDKLVPHDLRRSAVVNLTGAGVSEWDAMLISGHKTPGVFRRYNIRPLAVLQASAAKVDGYLNGRLQAAASASEHSETNSETGKAGSVGEASTT